MNREAIQETAFARERRDPRWRDGQGVRILLTGVGGKLGCYLSRLAQAGDLETILWSRKLPAVGWARQAVLFDLQDFDRIQSELNQARPDVIVHSAALSAVSDCYQNPKLAKTINADVPAILAQWCERQGKRLVQVSTDMVFDGNEAPYSEEDGPSSSSVYGQSKREGELAAQTCSDCLVVRVALMVGPALGRSKSHYDQIVNDLRSRKFVSLFADEWRGMLSYESAAQTLLRLARSKHRGLVHLAGTRRSRLELGYLLAEQLGCPGRVLAGQRSDLTSPEPRPRDLTLDTKKLQSWLPDWKPCPLEEEIQSWLP